MTPPARLCEPAKAAWIATSLRKQTIKDSASAGGAALKNPIRYEIASNVEKQKLLGCLRTENSDTRGG